jgi:hypothetical protein
MMEKGMLLFLLLSFMGPVWLGLSGRIDFHADYRTADRSSAHIAPSVDMPDAVVQVYAAYAFNWRGLFSLHTWIAVKPKNAQEYTVYQVVGWRLLSGNPALSVETDIADRYWYGQKPQLLLDKRGEEAEKCIPQIAAAAAHYPYPDTYTAWPGPNSNTFTAYIARQVPGLQLRLPSNALGKDYVSASHIFSPAPSGTGYQFSVFGLFGVMLAREEGLEVNILGLVYGIHLRPLTLKLPGLGDIKPL